MWHLPEIQQNLIQYLMLLVYYFIAIIIAFYIPGSLVIRRFLEKNASAFEKFTISTTLGIVLWALQGFIFGYLGIRNLTYVYIIISIYFLIREYDYYLLQLKNIYSEISSRKIGIIIIFSIGIISQVVQSIPSSLLFDDGWFTFIADDSLWHVGLTEELVRHMPPEQPGISDVLLTGYHYLGNLVIADIIRIFRLPLFFAQFSGIYILLSFLYGSLMYFVLRSINISRFSSICGVIISYFSSDVIYLLSFITTKKFIWNVHPLEDGTMFLENPPRAFSYILILLGVYLFVQWTKNKELILGLILAIVFGVIIGFKVHTGLMALVGVGIFGLYYAFKREWRGVYVATIAVIISLIIYLPVNGQSGGPVFAPFEMARMFVVQPLLQLSSLEQRRLIYSEHNNILRLTQIYLEMFALFITAQFGIRIFGFLGMVIMRGKKQTEIYILLVSMLFGSFLIGTFFIQPMTWADIFNLYLAGGVILTILTVLFIEWLQAKKIPYVKIFLIIFLCLFLTPRYVYRMNNLIVNFSKAKPMISISEFQASKYIKINSHISDTILVFNNGTYDSMWSYVSALTERTSYLSGQMMLDNRQIYYDDRKKFIDRVFLYNKKIDSDEEILKTIKFLYLHNDSKSKLIIPNQYAKVYSNSVITVFEYKKYESN